MFPFILMLACTGKNTDSATEESSQLSDQSDNTDENTDSNISDTAEPSDTGEQSDTSEPSEPSDTADTSDTSDNGELAVKGSYISQYSDEHIISTNVYTMDFGSEVYEYGITSYDNQNRTIIAENSSINSDPAEHGKYSRFDWVIDNGGTLYVCQTTAYADTESDAVNTVPANSNDLANGCPGYGWLELTPL